MKILITGADGFIGKNLLEYLSKKNFSVIGISRKISNEKLRKISLLNLKNLQTFINRNKFDVVIHLAASINEEDPNTMLKNNYISTLNLLNACKFTKKFIFTSSHAVYGKSQYLLIDENHPTNSVTNYGLSKIICENLCKMFHYSYNLDTFILRLSSVYGKGQPSKTLIPTLISHSLNKESIMLHQYKNGYQIMDMINIQDVCQAIYRSIKSKKSFGIYNIATGNPITVKEIADEIIKINPSKTIIKKVSRNCNHFLYDTSKAKTDLQFESKIDFKKSLSLLFSNINKMTNSNFR